MRCMYCKKKTFPIDCKYCKLQLCTRCLLPEVHNCVNIQDCKNQYKESLSKQLISNKTVVEKIHNKI